LSVTRRLAALAVGAGLLLAGCGGGDGGAALPKDEWVQRVNAMCREQLEKWTDIEEPTSLGEALGYFDELLADSRAYSEAFEELGPPAGDERRYREALEQDKRGVELLEDVVEALRAQDGPRLQRLIEELDALGAEGAALARELGADDCARSPTSEGLR